MLQQEAACHTLVKAEASSNGAMDTATTAPVNFVAMTTATSMTVPEPMDEDPAVTISAQQVQGVQQTAVPQTVASQMFASRGVSVACSQPEILSVAPLQNPGLARPVMVQSRGNTQPLQPRPIPQPIVPQGSKVVPSVTVAGNQQVFFSTTSSPNKLIAIPGGNVPRFVQGLPGSIPRIQIVPQSRMSLQTTLRPIAPRLAANTNTAVRSQVAQIQLKPAAPRAGKQVLPSTSQPATGVGQQRVLLQAHSSSTQLRTIAPNLGNLPPGSKIQFPPGTIFKDGVVYVPQQVQSGASASGVSTTVQITPAPTSITQTVNGVPDPPSPTRQRKPCNCTKSQCLKLYCDCFANGEFCSNCNCNNCSNNIEHEQERSKAIKACLERNPHAFHPKIGKGKGETERRHNKGCHCKRSGCLKNYCECYEAKILCTNICKCTGCKNFEESPERKTLMHLADAAEVRVQQQNAAKTKLESQMEDLPSRAPILAHAGERLPFSFVTRDVVEATCRCLLVQASAAEKKSMSRTDIQKLILEEFGNCLLKVIHAANSRSAK